MPAKMTQAQMDAFLDEPHVGIIVTINKDGTPNPMPIWYIHRGGAFLMTTEADSTKARNIRRDARISMCIQQETLPYKSVSVWGTATLSETDAALTRDIAVRYLGEKRAAAYLAGGGDPNGVTISLRPDRSHSQDYTTDAAAG